MSMTNSRCKIVIYFASNFFWVAKVKMGDWIDRTSSSFEVLPSLSLIGLNLMGCEYKLTIFIVVQHQATSII